MTKRLARIRLLLRAQEHLQKNAQRAVDQASSQLDHLRKKEKALLTLMSEGDPMLVNALMHSHAEQIRKVSQQKKQMDAALKELQEQTRKQGISMEVVKRLVSVLEEEERREREKRDQLELIDQTAQRKELIS